MKSASAQRRSGTPHPVLAQRRARLAFLTGGENLAGAGSVARAHELFMASAGHRANVLRPQYTHVGVGIVAAPPSA